MFFALEDVKQETIQNWQFVQTFDGLGRLRSDLWSLQDSLAQVWALNALVGISDINWVCVSPNNTVDSSWINAVCGKDGAGENEDSISHTMQPGLTINT